MPKTLKLYKDKNKAKSTRDKWRKENYLKGRYGNRQKDKKYFNKFEKTLIKFHILPDRLLAKILNSSTNGIQAMRWRMKMDYLRMYNYKNIERRKKQ